MACSNLNHTNIISISAAFLQIIVSVIFIAFQINISILDDGRKCVDEIVNILAVVLLYMLYVTNILVACCYIYSALSNETKYMTCYGLILLTNIIFLLLQFKFEFLVLAVFECYCSMTLQEEYKKSLIPNDPENALPTYNSCTNDTNIPFAEPSSNEQINHEASPQIVPDPQVDPPTILTGSINCEASTQIVPNPQVDPPTTLTAYSN